MPTTKPSYDNIELNDDEIAEALRVGREKKDLQLRKQAYWDRINAKVNWKIPTAEQIQMLLLETKSQTGKPFQLTEWNKEVVGALCLYFAGDERFNKAGQDLSLNKGILLLGVPGVGKTHLMNFFSKNPHASYIIPTCKTISEKYVNGWTRDGLSTIEFYSGLQDAEVGHVYDQINLGICFGDLGAESDGKNYGNTRNVIEEIVFNRYESKLPFKYTHFTSNLDAQMIGNKYGERMRDRLREMCNIFVLDGKSFR